MLQADGIRDYCIKEYIKPALLRGEKGVFISAGEVHKKLNLSQSYPAVCAALGSNKFELETCAKRVHIEGPLNGSNTIFVFMFEKEKG